MFYVARFMGIWFPVQIPTVGPGRYIFFLNYKIVVVFTMSTQAVSHPLSQWLLSEDIQTHKKVKHYITLLLLCIARTISCYSQSLESETLRVKL